LEALMASTEDRHRANMNPQPRWKVWIFVALPAVGALLAVAGHVFLVP
jgi:hypothetical protein